MQMRGITPARGSLDSITDLDLSNSKLKRAWRQRGYRRLIGVKGKLRKGHTPVSGSFSFPAALILQHINNRQRKLKKIAAQRAELDQLERIAVEATDSISLQFHNISDISVCTNSGKA
jgi:hypothetical protein